MTQVTNSDIPLGEILDLVALQLGADTVAPGNRLIEDLGAESADILNLVVALEDRYGIEIDEAEIPELFTVADVHELVRERLSGGGS
jgi:acyl carrier protein